MRPYIRFKNGKEKRLDRKKKGNERHYYIYVEDKEWASSDVRKNCPRIEEWDVRMLKLSRNEEPNILFQISHIAFHSLSSLILCENRIKSVEVLNQIYLPSLSFLWLGNNQLISIKVLRASKWPSLKTLILNNSKIIDDGQELHSITQFPSKVIEEISLERYEETLGNDIRWSYKLSRPLFFLRISTKRWPEAKHILSLTQKHRKGSTS